MNTIHYVSLGNKSNIELHKSIDSLVKSNELLDYRINMLNNEYQAKYSYLNYSFINRVFDNDIKNSRYYKTKLNNYQTEYNLYLDSDTIILDKIDIYFNLLDQYDLVICNSTNQDHESFWHIDTLERNDTYDTLGYIPLQLQCGVFSWRQGEVMDRFFSTWHNEWLIYKGQDQAAFVRALHRIPIRYYILSNTFNGSNGSVIQHNFGKIR